MAEKPCPSGLEFIEGSTDKEQYPELVPKVLVPEVFMPEVLVPKVLMPEVLVPRTYSRRHRPELTYRILRL